MKSTSSTDNTPTPELVRTFFDSAAAALGPLAADPDFRYENTLHAFTRSGMRAVTPDEAEGWIFWAEVKFGTSRITGRLTYGDREFFINMVIGPRRHSNGGTEYGLWEWTDAFGISDERARGAQLVVSAERVRSIVTGLVEVLAGTWLRIATAGPEVVASMDAARKQVRLEYDMTEARRTHDRVASRAAEAFRRRDYQRVVLLLESVEGQLTPAERSRLRLARRYLSGSR